MDLVKEFDSKVLSIVPIEIYVMEYQLLAIGGAPILAIGLVTD